MTRSPSVRLRVGIDGRAFRSPAGGVRRYVTELGRAIVDLGEEIDLVALGARGEGDLPVGLLAFPAARRAPTNLGWQLLGVPSAARAAGIEVYHAPAYTAPLRGVDRIVLTIHDVSYARHPEWFPYRRDPLRRFFYRLSARAAAVVVTVSEFSRREIVAAYGLPDERIRVIPEAAAACFTPAREEPASDCVGVEHQRPYVLHVGDLHERRDLATALDAVLRVRARVPGVRPRLVLVGVDRSAIAPRLADVARRAAHPDAVSHLGVVSEAELIELYRGAAALVYPSRYEGFGLPLVEAMACGVPVVGARAGATPEVLGDAGLLCSPGDGAAFAEAIAAVLTQRETFASLRRRSIERARLFSWSRAARATVEVYRECASPTSR